MDGSVDDRIRAYWDLRIHDTKLSDDRPGTAAFYAAIDAHRFERLAYLPALAGFDRWKGRKVLDLGCGAGLDLMRFARGGAIASGIDLSLGAIRMARDYARVSRLEVGLAQADASHLPFRDGSFDLVYCHGTRPFVHDPKSVVNEARRVLRDGGEALFMTYNRRSWMYAAHHLFGVPLGHADAPVFRTDTRAGLARLLGAFSEWRIQTERLPARSRMHEGPGAFLFNEVFVRGLGLLPRRWIEPLGWHLVAICRK